MAALAASTVAVLAMPMSRRLLRALSPVRFRSLVIALTSSQPAAAARFVELSPVLRHPVQMPASGVYHASDALGALWKWMVAAPLGVREAKLMAACKRHWPGLDRDYFKAEIGVCIADGRAAALADALHATALARIDKLGPRLPSHRRQVLTAEAAEASRELQSTLAAVRARCAEHPTGGPLLFALASHIRAAPPELLREPSAAGQRRGAEHEQEACSWARGRWPRCEVLANCAVVASGAPLPPSLKAEFDALAIEPAADGADGVLAAVVEAKAGAELYKDLPKMLDAREALMRPGATLLVRQRSHPTARRLLVRSKPRIEYVFGCAGSFESIAARSVAKLVAPTLLDREVEAAAAAGDAGAACARLPDDQRGRMVCRVGFAPERAAAMQARVRAFEATLEALVARGEIGFWGPPLDKPDG